jgi:hypothetical protein
MPASSVLSLALVYLTASAWSISLGVLGLWLIVEDHQGVLADRWLSLSAGMAALSGAQIVFLLCIADRVFPRANKIVSGTLEGGLGAIFLGSVVVLALSAIVEVGMG